MQMPILNVQSDFFPNPLVQDIVAYKVDQVEPNIKMTRITPSSS